MATRAVSLLASFLLSIAALGAQARADLVVTQEVEGEGRTGEMTIRIKEGRARADMAEGISLLIDSEAGETIFLRHHSKSFTRMTAKESNVLAERLLKQEKAAGAPHLESTSERREIGGRQTALYVWSIGAMKMRFWVSASYPDAAKIQRQLDIFQRGGLAGVASSLMPPPGSLPGVRLCTEIELRGQKVTYTISSIREEPVPVETFAIPKDYREGPGPEAPQPSAK